MELLSINVALPVEIEHDGKTTRTGIFKKPVPGPTYVSKTNLSGDQQSDLKNHGGEHKAVYAFSYAQYAYWEKLLERPAMAYGQFGENLTISDLDEAQLYIGDEIQIGDCLLQITQPRVPCFKLGLAFENKHMPKLFVKHAATGIYLRVLQEGAIEKGNLCELTNRGKHQMPVQTLFKAFYDKDFENPLPILKTALDIDALSEEWRKKITAKLVASVSN
jgi:MOSC domain-containing protein YiiM